MMKKRGYIEVILSGICFGFLGYFGKTAYSLNILPFELLALRYTTSAIIMLVVSLIFYFDELKSFSKKEILTSMLLGIFGYALFSSLFFYALSGLSASLTVLLLYTYPVMVALLSYFILKESMSLTKVLAIFLVSVGMYFLVSAEWNFNSLNYLLAGIGAAFFYSLYILYSRKQLTHSHPFISSFYVQLSAGMILFLSFKNLSRPLEIFQSHSFFIILMAFICSFMAMTLFLTGLKKITSTETSILSTTEPISGIIIAYFFLNEKITLLQLFGGGLILIGIILLSIFEFKKEPSH